MSGWLESESRDSRPLFRFEPLEPRRLLAAVYAITDLGQDVYPYGINEAGEVVADLWTREMAAPVIWSAQRGTRQLGEMRKLGSSPLVARAINNHGEIVV